jgi:mono/diheme cytochrome c family protein
MAYSMCRIKPLPNLPLVTLRPMRRSGGILLLVSLAITISGCRQDMAEQPKIKPLSPTAFYTNGAALQPPEGTVAHGSTDDDPLNVSPDETRFPITVTPEVVARGQDRFMIYCSVCHGALGDGNGMVVRRGFVHPPSYHIERLRRAPVGHFYDVMTHGFGRMPDYAAQVPPADRWAIVAYIRALQLSQHATVAQLPPQDRQQLDAAPNGGQAGASGGAQ